MARIVRASPARLATAGVILLALFLGWYQALVTAPWIHSDERAHTGYVMALARGELPTITTSIEVPEGADDLATVLALQRADNERAGRASRDTVWVANHPPGAYLLALPGTWVAKATRSGYEVLWWQRAVNVLALALAVGCTAVLARELTGSPWAGAVAAGLFATTPYLSRASALGMTDASALAAMVAVVWAGARALRRGFDRSTTTIAAIAAVACGLTRLTALITAMAVLGAALAVSWWRQRAVPWRPALGIAAPVALLTGWFFALNVYRYGDPAASAELLARFDRSPVGSVLEVATDPGRLLTALRTLAVSRVDQSFSDPAASPLPGPGVAGTVVLVMVAVAGVALVAPTVRDRRTRSGPGAGPACGSAAADPTRDLAGWALLGIAVVVNWLMMAQHVSGGGLPHSRYLAIAVPAGCIVLAAAVDRLRHAAVPVGGALVLAGVAHNVGGLSDVVDLSARAGVWEKTRLGPSWSLTLMGVGLATAVAVMGLAFVWQLLATRRTRPARDPRPGVGPRHGHRP